MSEKLQSSRRRLEYGAVPLQPWTAPHPDMPGENYFQASLQHIRERLDANIHIPIEKGTIASSVTLEAIHHFCEVSLTDAHIRRITHHHENGADKTLEGPVEIAKAAEDGTATPTEMLSLLVANPHLDAVEMAKLTHPFEGNGDKAMMCAVANAIETHSGLEIEQTTPRFKTKRANSDIPALVILKKRPMALIETPDGLIEVIERKTFLVRGDELVTDENMDPRIDRLVKKIAALRETRTKDGSEPEVISAEAKLFDHINQVHAVDDNPQLWLDVLTTSVYARYHKDGATNQ